MRNTGILLFIVGIYIIINSGSFRDLVFGRAELGFLNPKTGAKGNETSKTQQTVKNKKSGWVIS